MPANRRQCTCGNPPLSGEMDMQIARDGTLGSRGDFQITRKGVGFS